MDLQLVEVRVIVWSDARLLVLRHYSVAFYMMHCWNSVHISKKPLPQLWQGEVTLNVVL